MSLLLCGLKNIQFKKPLCLQSCLHSCHDGLKGGGGEEVAAGIPYFPIGAITQIYQPLLPIEGVFFRRKKISHFLEA